MGATATKMVSAANSERRALVVGLGKTGLSCARFLAAHGVEVAVTDSRSQPPALAALREALPDAAVFVGGFEEAAFSHADTIVLSPGVSRSEPLVQAAEARGASIIGDIELFARHADAPVVAITGSNGKSTVTTLLGEMARAAGRDVRVGGNLGIPALDLLVEGEAPDLYVLELSSFQLETTYSLNAAAAAVLNVSEDHLDRYAGMDDYVGAKARIFQGDGMAVINVDDPRVAALAAELPPARVVRFGLGTPSGDDFGVCRHDGAPWLCRGAESLLAVDELGLRGWHNVANALAGLALGEAVGLERAAMLSVLHSFTGLPHRSQFVAERDGVAWFNDSKGTNVGATLAALRGLPGERIVLIAGGQGKGQDFSPLRPALAERGRAAVLIGQDAPLIETGLGGVVPVEHAPDMAAAVAAARRLAHGGDSVLLSPACASFDMFSGYEERGEVFMARVREELA